MEARAEHSGHELDLMTQGNTWRSIWEIAWPLLCTYLTVSLLDLVHVYVAGFLDTTAQAAVGLSDQIVLVLTIFSSSVGLGTVAVVSRLVGGRRVGEAISAATQSLRLAFVIGSALAFLVMTLGASVLPIFSKSSEVSAAAASYVGIVGFYLLPITLISCMCSLFRTVGNSVGQLQAMLLLAAVDVGSNCILVLSDWPTPGLGIQGIACSAVAGSIVASIFLVCKLRTSALGECITRVCPLSFGAIRQVLNVGVPSACQEIAWATSAFMLFFILSFCQRPTEAIASWTVGIRIEAFVFLPLSALALAVAAIAGQNIGARQFKRAWVAGWQVASIGVALMVVGGSILFVFAEPLAHFASKDPLVVQHTTNYLRMNALGEPFLALETILSGALQAFGVARFPMMTCFACHWAIRLPLALLLAIGLGLGPSGVWIAMTTSNILSGILIARRFYQALQADQ